MDTYHHCEGESFLLCVSPPSSAEAGRQTGAPCFFFSSPLLFCSDTDAASLGSFTASAHHCKDHPLVSLTFCAFSSPLSIHSSPSALSLMSAPVELRDNTEGKEEEEEERGGEMRGGAGHREEVSHNQER